MAAWPILRDDDELDPSARVEGRRRIGDGAPRKVSTAGTNASA